MKVILQNDVPKIGKKYDVKDVANGYAANYLLPRGLAQRATPKKIQELEALREVREKENVAQLELLKKNLESLKSVVVTIAAKANDKGHLFKGIHKDEIIAALREQANVELTADYLKLPEPIKEVGEHMIEVQIEGESASFKLIVKAE